MSRSFINQAVNVHSLPPPEDQISGVNEGEEHVHSFDNLIPACEFAVSLANEGHSHISLHTDLEGRLNLDQARRIARAWESGQTPLDAQEIEY
jgi:hypothetical protein